MSSLYKASSELEFSAQRENMIEKENLWNPGKTETKIYA